MIPVIDFWTWTDDSGAEPAPDRTGASRPYLNHRRLRARMILLPFLLSIFGG